MKKTEFFDEEQCKKLFEETLLSKDKIARKLKVRVTRVSDFINSYYTKDYIDLRSYKSRAASKTGSNNPMQGKVGDQHHNYKGIISDGKGYKIILKPDWYTGRKGSKHVFYHTVVFCEALGLSELPKGFVIHHIDGNPENNNLENLALVSVNGHSKIHSIEAQRLAEMRRELATSETWDIIRNRKTKSS